MTDLIKLNWLEQAKEIHRFHRSKLLLDSKWTIAYTAKALKRSLGSISESLMIAKWCKTHEPILEKFDSAKEALKFIRQRKKELELE